MRGQDYGGLEGYISEEFAINNIRFPSGFQPSVLNLLHAQKTPFLNLIGSVTPFLRYPDLRPSANSLPPQGEDVGLAKLVQL